MNADDAMLGASILGMLMCLLGGYWIGRKDGQDIERMNAQRLAPRQYRGRQ